jgi:membrane-bound metal-dependent hydrolase YbcI (DUF457 family)
MNGPTHRLVAGAAAAVYLSHQEQKRGVATGAPIAGGLLCSILTALPDIIEPATSPHHRQFFHGIAFAALLVLTAVGIRFYSAAKTRFVRV